MATYAIGDLQGCFDSLQRLLSELAFNPSTDTLWLVGDLVNRGPKSLETLRYIKKLDGSALSVLGNHDLHLLAVAAGLRSSGRKDTLQPILDASDCNLLCDWLRQLPLIHHDPATGHTLVHAGIHPQWTLSTAITEARRVEKKLRSDNYRQHMSGMFGNKPVTWQPDLRGEKRTRFAVNTLTRMRYLTTTGELEFGNNGPPSDANSSVVPWFLFPDRQHESLSIVFGHWSSLGDPKVPGIYALDRGCVWGNTLAALHVEADEIIEVKSVDR